jgi:hypothetical protein
VAKPPAKKRFLSAEASQDPVTASSSLRPNERQGADLDLYAKDSGYGSAKHF